MRKIAFLLLVTLVTTVLAGVAVAANGTINPLSQRYEKVSPRSNGSIVPLVANNGTVNPLG